MSVSLVITEAKFSFSFYIAEISILDLMCVRTVLLHFPLQNRKETGVMRLTRHYLAVMCVKSFPAVVFLSTQISGRQA